MKRSFRMIFIMIVVLTCLVALCACKDKAASIVEETAPEQVTAEEEAPAQEAPESSEEAAGSTQEETPADESVRNQGGEAGEDAATPQTGEDATGLQTDGDDADEEGETEGDGAPQEDYLSYLYRTNRKQYYEYLAEQGEIEILSLTFFDLGAKGAHGYPVLDSSDMAGDYVLSARGEGVASLSLSEEGEITLSAGGISAEGALFGDYDKTYEIITECEGELFGVATASESKAKVTYFLVIGQDAYGVVFRKELNVAQIDAEPDAIRALMQEDSPQVTEEEVSTGGEEETKGQGETEQEPQTTDTSDAEPQTDPTDAPTTDLEASRRAALAPIAESACYAFFKDIGGVAEISGEVTVTEESESYTLFFSEMSEEEFAAAEALFEGLTRIIFSAANQIYQRDFDGKVFTFTLLLSEEEGSISLRVDYAA